MEPRAVPDDEGPLPLVRGLRAAVDTVADAGRGARRWPAQQRTAVLADVDHAIAVLTSVRADLLVAQRDSGTWQGAGDASFAAWRARTSRTGMRAAVTEVRRADTWVGMPAMREAATSGQVSLEHLDVVARVASGASDPVREALASPDGQAEVVALARRVGAGDFARSMARWAAALDADAHERGHQAQRAARFLHLADTEACTRISGQLDRMAGHRLRLALEAVTGRPAADDDRLPEQRRADALETIAERILSLPDTTSGAAVRPHVSFVMTAETWAGLRARRVDGDANGGRATNGALGAGAGRSRVADGPLEPVTLEDGTPVPLSEVARALCDCELTRIVMDARSEPIDLGRTARTYTGPQRRAVIVRDRGCAWPSCETPARWCEVHHMRWWDRDDGGTSVRNGVLLCSFHHHEVHRQDLSVRRRRGDDGPARYAFTRPDGRVLAPTGHGPRPPDVRPPDLRPPGVRPPDLGPPGVRPPDLRPPGPTGTERPPDVRRPAGRGTTAAAASNAEPEPLRLDV